MGLMVLFKDIIIESLSPTSMLGAEDWGPEGWKQVQTIHDVLGVPYDSLMPQQFSLEVDGFTLKDKYDFRQKCFTKVRDSQINISIKVDDPQLIKKLKRLSKKGFDVQLLLSKRKEE